MRLCIYAPARTTLYCIVVAFTSANLRPPFFIRAPDDVIAAAEVRKLYTTVITTALSSLYNGTYRSLSKLLWQVSSSRSLSPPKLSGFRFQSISIETHAILSRRSLSLYILYRYYICCVFSFFLSSFFYPFLAWLIPNRRKQKKINGSGTYLSPTFLISIHQPKTKRILFSLLICSRNPFSFSRR